jgi:hypothetical protein
MHLNANNNVYSNIFSTDQLINMNTFDAMYEDDHNQIEHFMPINSSQEDLGGGGNGSGSNNSGVLPTIIMNENINIDNELHNNHNNNHNEFDNDSSDATSISSHIVHHRQIINSNNILNATSLTSTNSSSSSSSSKNNSNLNQILTTLSSSFLDDFNANNENLLQHHHHHSHSHSHNQNMSNIKVEKVNFNNLVNNNSSSSSHHLKSKACDMINLNKISQINASNNNGGSSGSVATAVNDDDDDEQHTATINFKMKDSSFGKRSFSFRYL